MEEGRGERESKLERGKTKLNLIKLPPPPHAIHQDFKKRFGQGISLMLQLVGASSKYLKH